MPEDSTDTEIEAARKSLEYMLAHFNLDFSEWEDCFKMGANIGTYYDQETGRKKFKILDVARIPETKPKEDDANVLAAGEIIKKADEEIRGAELKETNET